MINKSSVAEPAQISLAGFAASGDAQVYRYSGANLGQIVQAANQPIGAGGFSVSLPAASISLFVIPSATPAEQVHLPLVQRS